MSHLLETLLADQRRIEANPAYIAPVVADEDRGASARFVSLAGQDSRVARLMVQCAELRAQVTELEGLATKQAQRIGELLADIATLKGENATPDRGCTIQRVMLGDSSVMVEYDHGEAGEVRPMRALINGQWSAIGDVARALNEDALVEQIAQWRAA